MEAIKICDVINRDFKIPEEKPGINVPDQPLINADGVVRCRFDMFVRWPENSNRKGKKAFTYRADVYEKDPAKMLWSLVRLFKNKYFEFLLAELYDNSRPKADESRIILRYKSKQILINRLSEYPEMLKDHPLPDWLKESV